MGLCFGGGEGGHSFGSALGDAGNEGALGASRVCFFLEILLISDSFRLWLKDERLQPLQPLPANYVDSMFPPVNQGMRWRFRGNGH